MTPRRIQLRRTKGWRMPPDTVKVGRPGYFGNPFIGQHAANDYRRWLTGKMRRGEFQRKNTRPLVLFSDKTNVKREMVCLRGKNLACWCKIGTPCHADVLLELANKKDPRHAD